MRLVECKKEYKNSIIFENINLDLNAGIWHLKGKNGTGKSVLCRCILGLENFSSGNVEGKGDNVLFLPDTPIGEDWLSFWENVELMLSFYDITLSEDDINSIIEKLNITEKDKNYSLLSVGTAMKLGIFLVFIEKYWDMIIVDEALSHLDKDIRQVVFEELEKRAGEGATVIIVDHNLSREYDGVWKELVLENLK